MRRKNQNENSTYSQKKQQNRIVNDMHKLEEEDEDDGAYPPIEYDENYQHSSDSSDDEQQKFDTNNGIQNKQTKQIFQNQNSNDHNKGLKVSIYARGQEQKQQAQHVSKPPIENIQDMFKNQLEKKLKMKENLSSLSSIKNKFGSGDEESGSLKINVQENQSTQLQPITFKEQNIKSLNGSQKNINDLGSQGNSQNSSMVEVMNIQLNEISEARKKHLEQIKMKQYEQNIKNDKNLSDEQKKVKLDYIKHSMIVDRIKNIIEKTKKMKEQQFKPAKKEQRFEMQISIFKNLDTYLETKEFLQKINSSVNDNQNKQKQSQHKVQQENSTEIIRKKKNTKIFKSLQNNQFQEQGELKYENIQKILQKSYQYLNEKNDLILQQEQILGGSFLQQLEKMMVGDRIKEESQEDMLQLQKQLKQKFEQVTTQENQSDTNAFYDILQYQLETGYFCKVDPDQNKISESSSYEHQNNQINEIINQKVTVDKKRTTQTKQDELEEYRKKAKKITQLLLSTSKNILKKNIEENNLAIQQARRARANLKIQQYLNIKQLEKNIKSIPQKLQKAYISEPDKLDEDTNEQRVQQEKEEQEEQEEKKQMLKAMLPPISTNKNNNIDKQLQTLESTLTKLNSSSISQNIQKIRNSIDRRFSLSNEQKGIIVPSQKQSQFGKTNSPSSILIKNNQDPQYFAQVQNEQNLDFTAMPSSPLIKNQISQTSRRSNTNFFKQDPQIFNMTKQSVNSNQKTNDRSIKNLTESGYQYQIKTKNVQESEKMKGSKRILYKKQSSISKFGDKSPSSQMIQTEVSTQGSPILQAQSYISSAKTGQINRKQSGQSILEQNSFDSQFEQLNKKQGFCVMNIKEIVNKFKLKDHSFQNTNKFIKLDQNKYLQNQDQVKVKRQKIQSLSLSNQRSNQKNTIEYHNNTDRYSANSSKQKQQNNNQANNPYYPLVQQKQQIFNQIKSQSLEKQKSKQNNIFLTDNFELSPSNTRKNIASEKVLISNHFSANTQRRSVANLSDKLLQFQKQSDNDNNPLKLLKKCSLNYISEQNRNLEQIMNNINHFKVSYKNDKGYFSQQISELQLKLEQQQERLTNQPLDSLRLCLDGVSRQIKPYFFDRKQIQKIT
ncbi:hypothetical protein TTHERM_00467870 (macronuclear) [Tetrahymena thermophila SB210]|uniref:Uncharacterized protein n=1 Tax=Tetrahymena thermophila (strain SB210) TaxID=312017 RepID=I7M437_TETTS|nr:hypothetical protein TTHERM_00467870 [Tetrahymena thermophila SB210]EAS04837.2 hypothetical protein TTHERM_00467870 [Tetrahymena thermophila SB210]|eukprot:XP_001025082.2 hypothetical protein TTHERM_00467870 [Tetrahymena thermophila SB210]